MNKAELRTQLLGKMLDYLDTVYPVYDSIEEYPRQRPRLYDCGEAGIMVVWWGKVWVISWQDDLEQLPDEVRDGIE